MPEASDDRTSEIIELAQTLQLEDVERGVKCLAEIEALGIPADLFDDFVTRLSTLLPTSGDGDRVLVNLQRFLAASRSPQSWLTLFEREPDSCPTLVQLFASSQYMADILIADPEAFDLLRMTAGQPVEMSILLDEIMAAVAAATDIRSVMGVLRDYRHRETLRIAYGDFISGQTIEVVTEQLSNLTESIVRAAVWGAQRELNSRRPAPTHADGRLVGFSVIALGKLGGGELNYSSDVDLLFIYEDVQETNGPRRPLVSPASADEYFQRLGQLIIKLLSEPTNRGIAYRVDMRLRPHGDQGPLVIGFRDAYNYYDMLGRTWERQVFVKARAIAGDIELGSALVEQLQPWVYRRYLMRADITGIVALKRRIEQRSRRAGEDARNVKEGHGGIRDIEYVIQFLQLLNGGEEPSVRCTRTLEAIRRLHSAQCLTAEEQTALEENYQFLRRVEHFLQIMVDRQTHCLPSHPIEFRRLALRMGYRDQPDSTAESTLRSELHRRTEVNRQILDHLLHNAFEVESQGSAESDLILDPQPAEDVIHAALQPYGFADCMGAYRNLLQLSVESIPFLSTRRCRHFLAGIVPKLLTAIAQTPNPDATLISLANVSDSLGGKAVLWELFSANPPSMQLCVQLCACSPYLASILTSNPGMIDELLDSLMLDALPDRETMAKNLDELCRNARDIAPILHSFKNSMHLRVGVRDILGKDSIAETHAALSDIAEVCMEQVIHSEFHRLVHQLGMPMQKNGQATEAGSEPPRIRGNPAELVVLAVGKLGGREPNYHSDLDVIFLFDDEGLTQSLVPSRRFEATTNRHFFNQLCQRVIQAVTRVGSTGRLYDLDVRLRPLGRAGELAITIDDLKNYFENGAGQGWERQALCKARPIWGSPTAQAAAMNCVNKVLRSCDWSTASIQAIYEHRMQLQEDASTGNLKRGIGGSMDIEFLVQMLQLVNASKQGDVLVPGTLDALVKLRDHDCLDIELANTLIENYQTLRRLESGIRLMNLSARHELPRDTAELQRLAFLLRGRNSANPVTPQDGIDLANRCAEIQKNNRLIFNHVFENIQSGAVVERSGNADQSS